LVGEDEIPAAEQLLLGLCDHPGASWSIGSQYYFSSALWVVLSLGKTRSASFCCAFICTGPKNPAKMQAYQPSIHPSARRHKVAK